jgi:hypothetical protein
VHVSDQFVLAVAEAMGLPRALAFLAHPWPVGPTGFVLAGRSGWGEPAASQTPLAASREQ